MEFFQWQNRGHLLSDSAEQDGRKRVSGRFGCHYNPPMNSGCAVIALAFAAAALADASAQERKIPHFDIRIDESESSRAVVDGFRAAGARSAKAAPAARSTMAAAQSKLAASVPGLKVEPSAVLGSPETVSATAGAGMLTGPSANKPEAVVRGFVSANAGLFGLTKTQATQLKTAATYANPSGNLSWVHLQQTLNGIPVFQGTLCAALRKDGAIARTTGALAAALDASSF